MVWQFSCRRESRLVKISEAASIEDQWTEFRPSPPLRIEKDWGTILLDLEPPFKDDFYIGGQGPEKGKGILMPGGEVINPEIELTDEYNNTFHLVWEGSRRVVASNGSPIYGPSKGELPRDREYTTIRMRSNIVLKCRAIYWLDESGKDWK